MDDFSKENLPGELNTGVPEDLSGESVGGASSFSQGGSRARTGYDPTGSGYGAPNYGPAGQDPAGGSPYGAPPESNYFVPNSREMQESRGSAVSVVSLVFGILSVVCCWTFVLPFIFGLVAVICGIVGAVKRQKTALWLIGLITGVLGIVLAVVLVVSLIPIISSVIVEVERRGGDITPQDLQRILREYGIEVNIGAKLPGVFRFK